MTFAAVTVALALLPAPQPHVQPQTPGIRASLMKLDRAAAAPVVTRTPLAQQTAAKKERSTLRKVGGGVAGGILGFLGGALIGFALDQGNYDLPGLQGATIGAPIGAVVGISLGAKYM